MSLVLTPLVTDNFTPDANPLNPANWTVFTALNPLKSVSGKCSGTDLTGFDAEYYIGHAFPNDQYASLTVPNAITVGSGASFYIILRATADGTAFYEAQFFEVGVSGHLNIEIADGVGPLIDLTDQPYSPGDTFTLAVVGTTLYLLQNGTQIATTTSTTRNSGFIGIAVIPVVALSDVLVSNFVAGSAAISISNYSVPDCRNFATFPNASRTVQGTKIYDVQTSSNHAIPGTDSRVAGAPADSRVTPNIPQNSRTPGTFGPGE